MIAYLPTLYNDELVYSWFCRYYAQSGCLTSQMAMQELFCKKSDTPSKEFIGNLNKSAKEVITAYYPIDYLVIHHTMFAQYARFMPINKRKEALDNLCKGCYDMRNGMSTLARTENNLFLRYCPVCAKEDREKYGETYWHKNHQLRNICLCIKHKCFLRDSSVSAKSEHCCTFTPAQTFIPITDENIRIVDDNSELYKYEKYVQKAFDANIDFENDMPISNVLYDALKGTKYINKSGTQRNMKLLCDDMNIFYRQIGASYISSMYQIQRVLHGWLFDFSTAVQISFYTGVSIEELVHPDLSIDRTIQTDKKHRKKEDTFVNWNELDKETAPAIRSLAKNIYDGSADINGRPERVSEREINKQLGLKGHQLANLPLCKAILDEYAETYPESWARKVIWAYRKLNKEALVFYWSDIRKLSGVKKKNFPLFRQYLAKHAASEEVSDIIALIEISA